MDKNTNNQENSNADISKTDKENQTNNDKEVGGYEDKAEPTRYGDWEVNGRTSDF